jgi:stage II sporulation protein D
MRRLFLSIILLSAFIGMSDIAAAAERSKPTTDVLVRVAIARDAREIDLEIKGPYRLAEGKNSREFSSSSHLPKSTVRLLDKGFFINGEVFPYERLIISPVRDAQIKVNEHAFRGQVILIRTNDDRITVVNAINIEDYIKGVLYHEVSHHWPMEAIKAQAVATRTYALYSMNKNKDYDVTNDIYSQVYGGRGSERYRTGLAVERTVSEVLVFNGKILPAYFHACCGGMTQDAVVLWNINSPPLKGVPCLFCKEAPHMNWKNNMRLKNIQDLLNNKGFKMGLIKDIVVTDRDRSNRVKELKIVGRLDETLTIKANAFRELLGPNTLKSNNYEVEMKGYYVNFIGHGWGHGVGMCQWGARGMALQQFSYSQILSYYYPGADITDYRNVR